ncbi:MAG: hypothetical protein ACK4M7_06890, partial [Burkholderiales bacterium]
MFQLVNLPKNKCGFGTLDSLLALTLLASIMVGFFLLNQADNRHKEAKQLSGQTEAFTKAFARYLNGNYSQLANIAAGSTKVITPQIIQSTSDYWPVDLSTTNMYQQTPCVTVIKNASSGFLEAVMYYVGGKYGASAQQTQLVREAAILLGSKGGVLFNGAILGNSGWRESTSSAFLKQASQCGTGGLANNSVAVNLDMLDDWNHNLQPNLAITRGIDTGDINNQATLPGHMLNTNTAKTNIYFSESTGAGIILDNSNPKDPLRLKIQDNGSVTGSTTLGFGSKIITTLSADTIQPNQQGRAGIPCQEIEIGKTIADQGSTYPAAAKVLARNTLVCTQNDMLCASASISHTCYLPSITNSIIFQNNLQGVQDASGRFTCPSAVPFASKPKSGTNSKGYYFTNFKDKNKVPCIYAKDTAGGNWRPDIKADNCPESYGVGGCNGGCGGYDGPEIRSFGQYLASGNPTPMFFTDSGGEEKADPIVGHLSGYNTIVGYRTSITPVAVNCDMVCQQLPWVSSHPWLRFDQSTQPFNPHSSVGGYQTEKY